MESFVSPSMKIGDSPKSEKGEDDEKPLSLEQLLEEVIPEDMETDESISASRSVHDNVVVGLGSNPFNSIGDWKTLVSAALNQIILNTDLSSNIAVINPSAITLPILGHYLPSTLTSSNSAESSQLSKPLQSTASTHASSCNSPDSTCDVSLHDATQTHYLL